MGSAMLSGLITDGLSKIEIAAVEPGAVPNHLNGKISVFKTADEVPSSFNPNLIIFAVKPQIINTVVPQYSRFVKPTTLYISIAAGSTIHKLEKLLGPEAAIIRAMPNTPALIKKAITVACPNEAVSETQLEFAKLLLQSIGEVILISDETLLNSVTAISGSGPAYVFYMIECLTQAGEENGLPRDLAAKLALKTVYGASMLALESPDTPERLRGHVTSPGGTTYEALQILTADDNGLEQLIKRAVFAAARRSKELAG